MKLETIRMQEINKYPGNTKVHTKDQIISIRDSIQEFGYNDPIALDENNEIIEGHGRYDALQQINSDPLYEITILRLEGLSISQKKAYRIAHNKTNALTGFDNKLLKQEFLELQELDEVDLDLTGFDFIEIGEILDSMNVKKTDFIKREIRLSFETKEEMEEVYIKIKPTLEEHSVTIKLLGAQDE